MEKMNSLKLLVILTLVFGIILCGVFTPCAAGPKEEGAEVKLIAGGPEIILDHYPESNVVCIAVSVGAGSINETPRSIGISHFIEHMVFNGSERFTRDQISGWVEDVGGFLNAFTRKEMTIYFMLIRRDLAEEGLEILSQMLLYSIFPSEELAKERKIVLEEIRRTLDNPGQARGRLIDHYLYRGSRLTEPILGYPATLDEMTREQLLSYYRRFYKPSNMQIFVMGGFDRESIFEWIDDYFRPPVSVVKEECNNRNNREGRVASKISGGFGPSWSVPRWSNEITVRNDDRVASGFDILVRIPGGINSDNLARSIILADILSSDKLPIIGELEAVRIQPPHVSLEAHGGFAAFRFHFPSLTENEVEYSEIPLILKGLSHWKPSSEQVESARVSYLSSDVFDREKFHYYIMLNGEMMSLLGGSFLNEYIKGVEKVDREDIADLLKKTFEEIKYNACLVRSGPRRFAELIKQEKGVVETLANGCVVSARRRKGSEIAALNIMIKDRNCLETIFVPGSSIALHGLLEMSARGVELSQKLEYLGARIEWGDNPYIPMDDYRLSPSFSFIRLEVPAACFEEASRLLIDYILAPEFTQSDISVVQRRLAMELAVRSGSPLFRVKELFYHKLLGRHPFANSLFPDKKYWEKMSLEKLQKYSKEYFGGNNIIATLVSGDLPGESIKILSDLFSSFPVGNSKMEYGENNGAKKELSSDSICPYFPGTDIKGRYEFSSPGSGAYLMAGFAAPVCDSEEMAAILVTSEILNSRVQSEIRERLGLAYSTGCSAKPVKGGVITAVYLGTRAQNAGKAREEMKKEIGRLVSERPDRNEVVIAINRISSRMARRGLSSINQAFSFGKNLFFFGGQGIEKDIYEVELNGVNKIIDEYFSNDDILYIDLLPSPDAQIDKGVKGGSMKMR